MSVNLIDVVLILAFIVVVGLGYIGGVIRLLVVLIALYLALVVAGLFYGPLGAWLAYWLSALNPFTAQMVAFMLLLALGTTVLTISLFKTFPTLRLPTLLASADQVGGAALGIVAATFAAVITTVVLSFFFGVIVQTAQSGLNVSPFLLGLAGQLRASFLARYFVELSTPIFVLVLPWFPNGLPAILVAR